MNPEDIKIGERVSLSGYIANKTDKHFYITIHTGFNEYTKIKVEIPSLELYEIAPENGIKNTENAPKYDPCRLFRKGDKVRVVAWNGRKYRDYDHSTELTTGCTGEIWEDEKDEQDEGFVSVIYEGYIRCVPPCYLELVTPVEELEPYYIEEELGTITVLSKKDPIFHKCWHYAGVKSGVIALEAAQAERDRLNAKHRKEMEK